MTRRELRALHDKLGKLETLLRSSAPASASAPANEGEPGEPTNKPAPTESAKPAPVEEAPAYKSLLKRLGDMEKSFATERRAREEAEARAADQRLRTTLGDALTKVGVEPRYVRQAIALLVDADKRVALSDDGQIVFRDGGAELDLAAGLKDWIKTDEAKIYLAPRGASGSGDRPAGGKPPRNGGPPTVEEIAVKLQQALATQGGFAVRG